MKNFIEKILEKLNDILRYLKLKSAPIEDLEDSFEKTEEEICEAINRKFEEYVIESLNNVIASLPLYRHVSELNQQISLNDKLAKKNDSLMEFINKRKEYTDSLKSKIEVLKNKKNEITEELEKNKNILEESMNLELSMELKYMNRNELTNVLKNLIRRIIYH